MIQNEYNPDFVSPPGATLEETIEALGITQQELGSRIGRSPSFIANLITGAVPLTHDLALDLERVLGVPARLWENRERRYREYLARRED